MNGNWIGFTKKAELLVNMLKNARREGSLPGEVSIVRDIINKEIKYDKILKNNKKLGYTQIREDVCVLCLLLEVKIS